MGADLKVTAHMPASAEVTRGSRRRQFKENPELYKVLVDLTREYIAKTGRNKLGIAMLFERARWEIAVTTGGDDGFKINNSHRAMYSRLIIEREPDLAGVFETRRSREDTVLSVLGFAEKNEETRELQSCVSSERPSTRKKFARAGA
jgi:hypothetical protein